MKKSISTSQAPEAIGPYSQAISTSAQQWIFVSGQIPLCPKTMSVVGPGIAEQTRQVMENVKAVLNASGAQLSDVVKSTIYLKDLGHFADVNGIYAEYFPSNPPARACVEVAKLPREVLVEIDVIAAI